MDILKKINHYRNPLIAFYGNSKVYGKGNSLLSFSKAMDYSPDMIEMDIRQSREGIFYCYHGMEPFCRFLKFFKFSTIYKITKADRLESILEMISKKGNPIIHLDIKESNICPLALDRICQKFKFKYLFNFYSYKRVRKFKKELKNREYLYKCFCFFNIYPFEFGFKRAKESGVNIYTLYPWQFNEERINRIKEANMFYATKTSFFGGLIKLRINTLSRVWKKYGSLWIFFHDFDKTSEEKKIFQENR